MSFDMTRINQSLTTAVSGLGNQVSAQASTDGELTEIEMLELQHSMGKWTIMINMQSNIQKTWAEALKAIVQNMR